ncbi:hypothetical protein, partial [Devosia sp.]|uniref:hypothetical protein n=1 Tax=Devosia sp. TaxID=1871048 RepID=UPI001AC673D8
VPLAASVPRHDVVRATRQALIESKAPILLRCTLVFLNRLDYNTRQQNEIEISDEQPDHSR